jgi:hypothetical protein
LTLSLFEVDPSFETLDVLGDPEEEAKHVALYKEGKGILASTPFALAYVPLTDVIPEDQIAGLAKGIDANWEGKSGIKKSIELQKQWLSDKSKAQFQIIQVPVCFSTCLGSIVQITKIYYLHFRDFSQTWGIRLNRESDTNAFSPP